MNCLELSLTSKNNRSYIKNLVKSLRPDDTSNIYQDIDKVKKLYFSGTVEDIPEYVLMSEEVLRWLVDNHPSRILGYHASKIGCLDIVDRLINEGYNFDKTWVNIAILKDKFEVVKYFFDNYTFKYDLELASLEMVKYIISIDTNCDLNNIYIIASAQGRLDIIKYLVEIEPKYERESYVNAVLACIFMFRRNLIINDNIVESFSAFKNSEIDDNLIEKFCSVRNFDNLLITIQWLVDRNGKLKEEYLVKACGVGALNIAKYVYSCGIKISNECYYIAADNHQDHVLEWLNTFDEFKNIEYQRKTKKIDKLFQIDDSILSKKNKLLLRTISSEADEYFSDDFIDTVVQMIVNAKSQKIDNKFEERFAEFIGSGNQDLNPEADLDDI